MVVAGLLLIAAAFGLYWVVYIQPHPTNDPFSIPEDTSVPQPIEPGEGKGEVKLTAYLTAYTWWDNTPPGSPIIAFSKGDGFPTVHSFAGGTGTYADPITIAVGHSISDDGVDTPDLPAGTRLYVESLFAYFIIEDTCGDGMVPQNGPCHRLDTPGNEAPAGAQMWLDMWIEGKNTSQAAAAECASALTENYTIVINPLPGYPTLEGPLMNNECRTPEKAAAEMLRQSM